MAKTQTTKKTIEVYICPTPGCSSFFGSNSMPDLGNDFTGPFAENRFKQKEDTGSPYKHSRAECPLCRKSGKKIERIRISIKVDVPVKGPPTPTLPASTLGTLSH